jgi:hypothetical protein
MEIALFKFLYFVLGLANSLFLIGIFLLRRDHLDLIKSYGWVYLLLAVPTVYLLFRVREEKQAARYGIFLGIFLAYLVLEGLFDVVLKISFRDDWRLLTPYLALYYAMNYGFVVMVWKDSLTRGIIMLVLFALQSATNWMTH